MQIFSRRHGLINCLVEEKSVCRLYTEDESSKYFASGDIVHAYVLPYQLHRAHQPPNSSPNLGTINAAIKTFLLIHPHTPNFHRRAALLPRRQPLIPSIPELQRCLITTINPRLTCQAVRKPIVPASHSHILHHSISRESHAYNSGDTYYNKIEILIKRRRNQSSLPPRVGNSAVKLPTLPKRLIKVHKRDLKQARVHVRKEVLRRPLKAEDVEAIGKSRQLCSLFADIEVVAVRAGIGTPVD